MNMPDIDNLIHAGLIGYVVIAFLLQVLLSGVCLFILLWRSWPGLFFHGGWMAALSYWMKSILIVTLLLDHLHCGHDLDLWYIRYIEQTPVFMLSVLAFVLGDMGLLATLKRSKNLEQWAMLISSMKGRNPDLRAKED